MKHCTPATVLALLDELEELSLSAPHLLNGRQNRMGTE
jgi:hypothetical protein